MIRSFEVLALPILSSAFALCSVARADDFTQANVELEAAQKAFENKDDAAYVRALEKAAALGADHPAVLFRIAQGWARQSKSKETAAALQRIAALGLSFDLDADFDSVRASPEVQKVVAAFAKNMAPSKSSTTAFVLTDAAIKPEGLAYDPNDGVYYLASTGLKKILRRADDAAGKLEEFSAASDGLYAVYGVTIDRTWRELWASSFDPDTDRAGLFQYAMGTKKLLSKYLMPRDSKNHALGDVLTDRKGTVYTTDSATPGVYFLRRGGDRLEKLAGEETFRSPQGLTLSPDEKTLFVADYSRGIYAIDLATKKATRLPRPKNTALAGIDGLYFHRDALIATQNGFSPKRVLRLVLDKPLRTIRKVDVLQGQHPAFGEPTLGVLRGEMFEYVANDRTILRLAL